MISRRLKPPGSSCLLFGPRMTGKSTWLRHHCAEWLWVDLLRESDFQLYLSEPARLRKELDATARKPPGVVIDEVQRVPALLNEVQALIEERGTRFFLSGSSARKLRRGGANLLAGRAAELRLFPLTFLEAGSKFRLEDALRFGMLPKVFLSKEPEKRRILRSYVGTYLREEVQAEGLVRNLPSFSKFLALAADACAQELNFSEISRQTTVKSKTIREYFGILEDTWLGHLLPPWDRTVRKQLAGSPKFYFFDNGVANALRETLSGDVANETRGALFEQWVINEIRAELSYREFEGSLYFWKARGGAEVDLLVAKGSTPIAAIEIKRTSRPGPRHFTGLKSIAEEYPKIDRFLVCTAPRPYVERGTRVYPYQRFLEDLGAGRLLRR